MKSIIDFINEKQNFLIKGHTKKQSQSLMYYAQQFLEKGIVEPEKYIEPLRIFGADTYIHIGPDKISDNDNYIDEKECEKRINDAFKVDAVHLNFKVKDKEKFEKITPIIKSIFKKSDVLITHDIYIEFSNLDDLKEDLDFFLEKYK